MVGMVRASAGEQHMYRRCESLLLWSCTLTCSEWASAVDQGHSDVQQLRHSGSFYCWTLAGPGEQRTHMYRLVVNTPTGTLAAGQQVVWRVCGWSAS